MRRIGTIGALGIIVMLATACTPENDPAPNTAPPTQDPPKAMTKQNTGNYTGQLIEKPFINKVGEATGPKELYLRLGMGDYFIKFKDSVVSAEDLRPHLGEAITVEGEIQEGEWDIGPDDPEHMQSRIGEYFVIHKWVQ